MTNFWCAAFCLPQASTDEIESPCAAFLWSGSPNITSRAKVAWADVCCPYEDGGLGIRSVKEVTTVFILKLIWRLHSYTPSLWTVWVRRYLLQNDTLWDAKDTNLGSWVWKKYLSFPSLAKEFIRMDVRDGTMIKFWTDVCVTPRFT